MKPSGSGAYSVLSLDPVFYSDTVEAGGFRKEVVESVKVDTATTLTVNVTLDGFKLYRLRQALGTTGLYTPNGQSRYIQLGLKIFF